MFPLNIFSSYRIAKLAKPIGHELNMKRIRQFFNLSRFRRFLLAEAALFLGLSRFSVLVFPFRWLVPLLGQHMAETAVFYDIENNEIVTAIAQTIHVMSRHLPWTCNCFAQALAGKMMLRRRGIDSTIYFGLATGNNSNPRLCAHAWLRHGDVVLTGLQGVEQFKVLSTFAN